MDYPDPNTLTNSPRPYTADDGARIPIQQPDTSAAFTDHIQRLWPASTSSRNNISLSDYFTLGGAQFLRTPREAIRVEGDDNDGAGDDVTESPTSRGVANRMIVSTSSDFASIPISPSSPAPPNSDATSVQLPRSDSGALTGNKTAESSNKKRPRGWKNLLRGTEHADLFKTPRLHKHAGGSDTKPRGRQRGKPTPAADPGEEFKKLQRQAMSSWMQQDYEAAEQFALDAIMANPEVYEAHSLLSDVLNAQGRAVEAVYAKHIGAPVAREANIYVEVAQQWVKLYEQEEDDQYLSLALDDYRSASALDKTNFSIRRGMRDVNTLLGDFKSAKLISKNMLKIEPGDIENVQKYAELCAQDSDRNDTTDIYKARDAYDQAFALHYNEQSFGDPEAQWSHLNVYLDLLDRLGSYSNGVLELRRKARWYLGRKDETFWDRFADDREFDLGNERRAYVWEFQQGRASRDMDKYGEGLPIELRVKLGLFRLKMGTGDDSEALKHLDHLLQLQEDAASFHDLFVVAAETLREVKMAEVAIQFYECLRDSPDLIDEDINIGLAECYKMAKRDIEAINCYLAVIQQDRTSIDARVHLAKLYESMGLREKAIEMADEVIELGHEKTARKERLLMQKRKPGRKPGHQGQTNMRVTKPTVKSRRPIKPRPYATEGAFGEWQLDTSTAFGEGDFSNNYREEDDDSIDTRTTEPRRLGLKNIDALREQHEVIHRNYAVVKELWHACENDHNVSRDKWIRHARAMVESFWRVRSFFPRHYRHQRFVGIRGLAHANAMVEMEAMKDRIRDGDNNEGDLHAPAGALSSRQFHDISFLEWHQIACELALAYAKQVRQEECFEIVNGFLMKATVFRQDAELSNTTCALAIYCALLFNDTKMLSDTARNYIIASNSRSGMAYQLLGATARLSYGELNMYVDSSLQKFLLRSVRRHDESSLPAETRKDWDYHISTTAQEARGYAPENGEGKDGMDAGLLMMHGHMLDSNKTRKPGPGGFSYALSFLLRGLSLQPDNPTVNLSIAVMFMKSAMSRQTQNRQHEIAKMLAFFYRYYDHRVANRTPRHKQEAEFNLARLWHQLGMTHLAVPGYEKVLSLSEQVQGAMDETEGEAGADEVEDFAKEAAFALQNLFALGGNMQAANAITEQWLVL